MTNPPTPLPIRIGLWLWLIAALLVGRLELLRPLPLPAIQGVLFGLTAGLLVLYFKVRGIRAWLDALDLRVLLLFHLTRFVGIYFLILYGRGELPYDFAVRGGWGDIIAASLALLICVVPLGEGLRRRAITIWNVIGFIDIMMVVLAAARNGLQGNPQMKLLTVLPLVLLPAFIVPVIIATHVIIFVRLRRESVPRMKPEWKYGLISGAGVSLWILGEYALGFHTTRLEVGEYSGYFSAVIPLATFYFMLRRQRDAGPGGRSGVWAGFTSGLHAAFISGLIIWAFMVVYGLFINPGWLDHALDWQVARFRADGMSEPDIRERILLYRKMNSPVGCFISIVAGTTVMGGLFATVIAFLLRRRPRT